MISFKHKLGKRGISEELVRTILVVVVMVIFLYAARSMISAFLFVQDPKDVESEASFLNLAEQMKSMINEPGAYASKDNIPITLSDKYSIIGLSYSPRISAVSIMPYSYLFDESRYIDNSDKDLPISRSTIFIDNRTITQCQNACICLIKNNDPELNGKSYETRLEHMSEVEKNSKFNYVFKVERCVSLGENIWIYSYTTIVKSQFLTSEVENGLTKNRIKTLAFNFLGNNYGAKSNIDGLTLFSLLSKSAEPYTEENAKYKFAVNALRTGKYVNYEVNSFYSGLYLNDFTKTTGMTDVKLFIENPDISPNQYLGQMSKGIHFSLSNMINKQIHIDKIDFRTIKSSNPKLKNQIFLFVAPLDSGISGKNFLEDGSRAAVNTKDRSKGIISFDGKYSLLDLRKKAFYQLRIRKANDYSIKISGTDDKFAIMYVIDYLSYSINPLLFTEVEGDKQLNELGYQSLIRARDVIEKRIDDCSKLPSDKKSQCENSFFDNCEWTDSEICDQIIKKEIWTKSPMETVDYINQKLIMLSKNKPALSFDFVLEDALKLEKQKKYNDELKLFEDFVDKNHDIFYDLDNSNTAVVSDETADDNAEVDNNDKTKDAEKTSTVSSNEIIADFESSIPKAVPLREMLTLSLMVKNDKFKFQKTKKLGLSDGIAFVMVSDAITYTLVPADGVIYDDDPIEQSEYDLGYYTEDIQKYDLKYKLVILKILKILEEKKCITTDKADELQMQANFDQCEAENIDTVK